MNSKKIKYLFGVCTLLAVSSIYVACGKADGYANSGMLTTYNFVYFGNLGSSTLNSFYVAADGSTKIVSNTISTGSGTSSVNDLVGSTDGKFLYSTNKSTNNLSWFSVDPLTLSTAGAIAYSNITGALGSGSSAMKIHPNGNFCYIANSTSVSNNISVGTINKTTGAITVDNITFYTARTTPMKLAFSPDGRNLFVVNRGTSDISTFTVNAQTGALITLVLSTPAGTNPEDLVIHPSGRYLYTLSPGSNTVVMHAISTSGTLTPLATPTVATGAGAKKIAITPNGNYVFVTNNTDNTISIYSVNSSNGILAAVTGSPFAGATAAGVYAAAVTGDSKYLIITGDSSAKGYIYSINNTSGAIAQIGADLTLGANPRSVGVIQLSDIE